MERDFRSPAAAAAAAVAAVAVALMAVAAGSRAVNTTAVGSARLVEQRHCSPPATQPLAPQPMAEGLLIDVTGSTASSSMRKLYEQGAAIIVQRAAAEKAVLRIVGVGASGVGAAVWFEGSFAPRSSDEVFNLAARNRELCLARQAIATAARITPDPLGGSDISGSLATAIRALRGMAKPGGEMTVTVLTDGCQSPAARGPNHRLTNLCGQLTKGKSPATILRAHAAEFDLGNAREVTMVMRGIGVGRNPRFANTLFAQKLVGFWTLVCRRANARACLIGSSVL